ncbi:hypothetical protein [uncultured Intestinimonas sp.]|uniref:hypothetical protein n=1 Tax=uncultured Intestinimonas sp. TaxID=1689265 RepID=UPI0025D3AAF8|nr:hypothetical protein [uncultured Intestinimonas sp.]
MSDEIWLFLGLLCLMGMLAAIVAMVVSLARQGDERRRLIVAKAGLNTLCVVVAYLFFCVVEGVVVSVRSGAPAEDLDPFVTLVVIAMIYAAQLFYFKRKYGD